MSYRRFKHATIQAAKAILWELGVAQILIGVGLWAFAYIIHSGEPPVVLAMSALALVFSGITTMTVVAATDGDDT